VPRCLVGHHPNAFLIRARPLFPAHKPWIPTTLAPLVIPGVILGISILAFASHIANLADELWGWSWSFYGLVWCWSRWGSFLSWHRLPR
jgi:ABC-type spermidine/putrescine transport system permease subunit II